MATAALLTFSFLIFQVNSQVVELGPTCVTRGFEPTAPYYVTEIYRPSVPVGIDPGGTLQAFPNLVSLSQPIPNTITLSQPYLNVQAPPNFYKPVPSGIKNQVPPINQTVITNLPLTELSVNVLTNYTNSQTPPVCTNTPQPTPPIIANPATQPVMTVVDNTLANSLANALQLLIFSNILENTGTDNLAQNLPCINNYEIVAPDFAAPAIACEYLNNVVYPEPVVSIPEPVVSSPEPVVLQCYPTNFGGSLSGADNPGFQCGPNQIYFGTPTQYIAQVAPACNEPRTPIPAVAELAPMALEVPFPSSIPAQLTCNFGLLPSNQPCVSFNVEPLPCDNVFGNF